MTAPIPPRESTGDATLLATRLAERGLRLRVEGMGGVALVTGETGMPPTLDPPTRRAIVQLAREAGFANVALELPPSPSEAADAPLPGSEPG